MEYGKNGTSVYVVLTFKMKWKKKKSNTNKTTHANYYIHFMSLMTC